jgi:hypothetical protein
MSTAGVNLPPQESDIPIQIVIDIPKLIELARIELIIKISLGKIVLHVKLFLEYRIRIEDAVVFEK